MKRHPKFSFQRLVGIISKEFLQMRRDRLTFAMMLGIPLIQLTLFGFAINSDPRHLPAAVLLADQGPQGRTLLYAMKNSTYFDFVREVADRVTVLHQGKVIAEGNAVLPPDAQTIKLEGKPEEKVGGARIDAENAAGKGKKL